MRDLFKKPPVIFAVLSLVFAIAYAISRFAYDGHPPVWAEIFFGFGGVMFCVLMIACVFLYGLLLCFYKISKWARIDSWGHFIPMLVFVVCISASVLFAFAILVKWKYPSLQSRGEFGDSFGALNTFFSTAAFLALLVSIAMQRRQMMDEREKDKVEQDQKRRASWPAVVLSSQKGYVSLYGATNTGMPILRLQFMVILRNVSNRPILNVFPKILFEKFYSDNEFIEAKTDGATCIEPGGEFRFDFEINYAITDMSDTDKVIMAIQRHRHLISVTSFATAQRLYYSASQMSVINLMPFGDVRNDILAFLDWVRDSRNKEYSTNKQYKKQFFPYEYSFSVLPLTCDLKEITYEEYKKAVADGVAR